MLGDIASHITCGSDGNLLWDYFLVQMNSAWIEIILSFNEIKTDYLWCIQGQTINYVFAFNTVKLVCNDHIYNKLDYLWFIQ